MGVDIIRNFAGCVGSVINLLGSVVSVLSAAEEDFSSQGGVIYAWTDKKTRSRWRWSARKQMQ